jgi:elongation factor P--(R)-beta-lysine ligase
LTTASSPWWEPHVHADRRPFLLARNRIVSNARAFFEERGFIDVDCGPLQVSPGNETHLHAMSTELLRPGETARKMYLHTSPEFACKKLLAAGEPAIFALAKVYRNRERSPLHSPEFTMLEWYRANQSHDVIMRDVIDLLRSSVLAIGARELRWKDLWADPFAVPDYITVAAAFRLHGGFDLMASLRADGSTDREAMAKMADAAGMKFGSDESWSDIFSRVISERIEKELGRTRPTVLYEYPSAEAALARKCAHDPRVAERFEVYACGVELANGFGELTDADEQRARFIEEMDRKERIYGERYPLDEDLLAALAIMPEASGVALGLDRLVMLATGATRIEQVIWTPVA